jgi:hypothetical protein
MVVFSTVEEDFLSQEEMKNKAKKRNKKKKRILVDNILQVLMK